MTVALVQANALALPLADSTVDLIVTSPPYFGLRSYTDNGEHYDGQIGSEATPTEFVDALIAATAEMVRVLKPSGSIWVNLGDKYAGSGGGGGGSSDGTTGRHDRPARANVGLPTKSLMGIPWRYAIRCIDELGLILRAEIIWSKPNGLPESVTDRVRRSHEQWFHFTVQPRYYSAVDRIREEHAASSLTRYRTGFNESTNKSGRRDASGNVDYPDGMIEANPLGKLPGSVRVVATEPLTVPAYLGVDHYAAFPTAWPRWIIQGWSPERVCTICGEGLAPVVMKDGGRPVARAHRHLPGYADPAGIGMRDQSYNITGESCACDQPGPTTPGIVLDPFGGTGTTALCADVLGRNGISVDMSADYLRIATWRTNDPKQRAKAARVEYVPPREQVTGQAAFQFEEATA